MLKRLSPLDLFLAVFILMYYGRLSVVMFVPQFAIDYGIPATYLSLHFAMLSVGCADFQRHRHRPSAACQP